MDHLIALCGFLGGWLLVAGPLSQATRELEEEEIERETILEAKKGVKSPPGVSRWWWLAPPVHYLLERRRSGEFRAAVLDAMPSEQVEAFVSFRDKADTWATVALGAFLIAVKETWDLRESYGWPQWAFWALIALMIAASVVLTIARIRFRRGFGSPED